MNVATIPPGGVGGAHIHVDFEVMLYILEGRVRHEYGEGLSERVDHEAGDFIFIAPGRPPAAFDLSPTRPGGAGGVIVIAPGVPHEVFNLSQTGRVVAVAARSSADEWDQIVPYDRRRG